MKYSDQLGPQAQPRIEPNTSHLLVSIKKAAVILLILTEIIGKWGTLLLASNKNLSA